MLRLRERCSRVPPQGAAPRECEPRSSGCQVWLGAVAWLVRRWWAHLCRGRREATDLATGRGSDGGVVNSENGARPSCQEYIDIIK